MGWGFPLRLVNLVAYVTRPTNLEYRDPPRTTHDDLRAFIGAIQMRESFWSGTTYWLEEVGNARAEAESRLRALSGSDQLGEDAFGGPISASVTRDVLKPFDRALRRFALYGVGLARWSDFNAVKDFIVRNALRSGSCGLFLLPMATNEEEPELILDPWEPIAKISDGAISPTILLWSFSGTARLLSLPAAEEFCASLFGELTRKFDRPGVPLQSWRLRYAREVANRALRGVHEERADRRILQLSDLHFGNNAGLYAKTHLLHALEARHLREVDRTVITGDLLDSPSDTTAQLFEEFRSQLEEIGAKKIFVIPGNHDQKWRGNSIGPLFRRSEFMVDLDWSELEIDEEARVLFLSFDSSREAPLAAKGKVSRKQRLRMAAQLHAALRRRPEAAHFLRVALVHHHPFPFDTGRETRLRRVLGWFGMSPEDLLGMDEAAEFVEWCAAPEINTRLILHGHRHVPRHVVKAVNHNGVSKGKVTSIGCGSSLGAERTPLGFNIVSWNVESTSWSASFYEDIGDGRGFEQIALRIDMR